MNFPLQPTHLSNEWITLSPLAQSDFDTLYAVASDPLVWEQHPSPTRYQLPVFSQFFEGAMASGGAFLFRDTQSGEAIGSSRFYDLSQDGSSIYIGYSFFARSCWGKPFNRSAKVLMLNHAFEYLPTVLFSVGAKNIRSQMAMLKLGAVKFAEKEIAYYGENNNLNFLYKIDRSDWTSSSRQTIPARIKL